MERISGLVKKFADAQNNSYEVFNKYKFGDVLNPSSTAQTTRVTQNRFNSLFKEEFVKVVFLEK